MIASQKQQLAMSTVSILSAMPLFLRHRDFLGGAIDPKIRINQDSRKLSLPFASCHRWGIDAKGVIPKNSLREDHRGILDIAQSILERGIWTIPSWNTECRIADLFCKYLKWSITQDITKTGSLQFRLDNAPIDIFFAQSLVSARWQVEADNNYIDEIWNDQPSDCVGSPAERYFLESILAPVLGFPLLDYLHLQFLLTEFGLDFHEFTEQRADFVLNTEQGLKVVIEVDGEQHLSAVQSSLDNKRDHALKALGWKVWRVPTTSLSSPSRLKDQLVNILKMEDGTSCWGSTQLIAKPRSKELLSCVWGATVSARIHFLLLEALRIGVLSWNGPWRIGIIESNTNIADNALDDFRDWFGRLKKLYGFSEPIKIQRVYDRDLDNAHFLLDISVINPRQQVVESSKPVGWSRPANRIASTPKRAFAKRMTIPREPSSSLLDTFVRDFLRKSEMRDGQHQIINRILMGNDVIGLLPTGGGKSLTYQISGLLLGGLTIYVSPLKSLLQDQRERLLDLGIDWVKEISSSQSQGQNQEASMLLASGGVRYLLIVPERFLVKKFRDDMSTFLAQSGDVSQVIIDECHCVSEWGHDFRPAYLSLSRIVKERTNRLAIAAPLVALTGTASSIVLADVQRELGVDGQEAVIRAKRLDRPEIAMTCIKMSQSQKRYYIKELIQSFYVNSESKEGLLLFCRFIGMQGGVLDVSAIATSVAPKNSVRFYCGSNPKWEGYAAFLYKKSTRQITARESIAAIPPWALTPNGNPREWEEVKAQTQTEFIGDFPGSFKTLIATSAFGMGIDKPSIRQVIHFTSPQSPEAYYQEIGRAGRDGKSSSAVLLFSDEDASVTDQLLDPGSNIDEVRKIHEEYLKGNKFGGGDFIRTFYFHKQSFSGPLTEANVIVELLLQIRKRMSDSQSLLFEFIPDRKDNNESAYPDENILRRERSLEYAVIRLILLGVVQDYTKNFNGKYLELSTHLEWEYCLKDVDRLKTYLAEKFQRYTSRYQANIQNDLEVKMISVSSIEEVERITAKALVEYIYEQVERKRRQASRQMLELARKGVEDSEGFRKSLIFYLQVSEKFTHDLETLVKNNNLFGWTLLVDQVGAGIDDIKELHGACQRVLESYPTHPGLLSISAVTRLSPTKFELERSREELSAALRFSTNSFGTTQAKANGDAIIHYAEQFDSQLSSNLQVSFALWLIANGMTEEAVKRFIKHDEVRRTWLSSLLREVKDIIPAVKEL